ncbi:MAG TPA: lamin tail domain-containing protein, partial [Anaerolineales bacterium]|nr:lamin tail domain-containing protein [Anaerolineales bacterium]
MPKQTRFSRLALILMLLCALCVGTFSPRVQQVEAKPVNAADELNVFISEFRVRGPNGADDEFVEIFNATGGSISLNGWKLRKSSGCGSTLADLTTIGAINIAPGQYYLIAKSGSYSGSTTADLLYTTTGISDDGGIALVDATNKIIDQVGLCADTTYKEGTTISSMSGTANQSYERKSGNSAGSCFDTDNNSTDFIFNSSTSNPQNFSSAAIPCLSVTSVASTIVSPVTYSDISGTVIDIQLTFSNVVTVTGSPT